MERLIDARRNFWLNESEAAERPNFEPGTLLQCATLPLLRQAPVFQLQCALFNQAPHFLDHLAPADGAGCLEARMNAFGQIDRQANNAFCAGP